MTAFHENMQAIRLRKMDEAKEEGAQAFRRGFPMFSPEYPFEYLRACWRVGWKRAQRAERVNERALFANVPCRRCGLTRQEHEAWRWCRGIETVGHYWPMEVAVQPAVVVGRAQDGGEEKTEGLATCPRCEGYGSVSRAIPRGDGLYASETDECVLCDGLGKLSLESEQGGHTVMIRAEHGMGQPCQRAVGAGTCTLSMAHEGACFDESLTVTENCTGRYNGGCE